jgi:hypothetical protein
VQVKEDSSGYLSLSLPSVTATGMLQLTDPSDGIPNGSFISLTTGMLPLTDPSDEIPNDSFISLITILMLCSSGAKEERVVALGDLSLDFYYDEQEEEASVQAYVIRSLAIPTRLLPLAGQSERSLWGAGCDL